MKNTKIFITAWLILIGLLIAISSFSQTDNYSCNVVCLNQSDYVMEGVKVDLFDSNDQYINTTYTGEDGYFTFNDLVIGESYVAKFNYDAENTFVDMGDAFQILYYLIGFVDFDDIQMIAADVDGDDDVDFRDFITVFIDYFIRQEPFPVGDWQMPDWNFTLDGNKATGGPAGTIVTGNIGTHDDNDDKSTLKVFTDYVDITSIDQLNIIEVPVYFNENTPIAGIGFIANFNNELFEVVNVQSNIEDLNYNASNGQIRIGWAQIEPIESDSKEALFTIQLKQKYYTEYEQIERFEILESTHILNPKGQKIPFIGFTTNEFKTAVKPSITAEQVYPNPCNDFFYIQIDEAFNGGEYLLFNSLGQIVDNRVLNNEDGPIKINTNNLDKGIYYYKINYQSKSITGPLSIR